MSAPRIGASSLEHRPVCLYSLTPTSPQCENNGTVHLIMDSGTEDCAVTLVSCDVHLSVARAAGTVLGEHPYDAGICGMPGTTWYWEGTLSWCGLALPFENYRGES